MLGPVKLHYTNNLATLLIYCHKQRVTQLSYLYLLSLFNPNLKNQMEIQEHYFKNNNNLYLNSEICSQVYTNCSLITTIVSIS